MGSKPREELITSIFDPNRSTVPGFAAYTAVLEDGRAVAGILAAETGSAVTIRRAEGLEETVGRASIRSLESSGQSLMPEGLEGEVSEQNVGDLLEFLRSGGGK